MIDRLAPTRRPAGKASGYQKWRSLLFIHWPIPVEAMRAAVPDRLELDLWEGQAYIGIVPFAMEGVRPWWCPAALGMNFLETNLRTYVISDGRPGVYFFSLEAASKLAVWVARQFWGLPYYHANMTMNRKGDTAWYRTSRRGQAAELEVRYEIGEQLEPSEPGALEFFLLERYLLFVEQSGRCFEGQVHHTPYPAHRANVLEISDSLVSAAGLPPVEGPPAFAHYSPGVDVEIFFAETLLRRTCDPTAAFSSRRIRIG